MMQGSAPWPFLGDLQISPVTFPIEDCGPGTSYSRHFDLLFLVLHVFYLSSMLSSFLSQYQANCLEAHGVSTWPPNCHVRGA